jgi:hypothetical protein
MRQFGIRPSFKEPFLSPKQVSIREHFPSLYIALRLSPSLLSHKHTRPPWMWVAEAAAAGRVRRLRARRAPDGQLLPPLHHPPAASTPRRTSVSARSGSTRAAVTAPPPAPPHPTCPTQLTRERTPTCVQRHSKVANRTRRIAVQIPVHTQTQVRSTTPPLTGAGHVRGGWT